MSSKVSVLITGLNEVESASVKLCTASLTVHDVKCDADALMESNLSPVPAMIFCGSVTGEISPSELAQLLRSCYQDSHIYFVSSDRHTFKRDILIKNGFNDAFLVPIDNGALRDGVTQRLADLNSSVEKSYRSVSLIDVASNTTLSFDVFVFLPMNGKHVRFSCANETLSETRSERLKKHQVKSLHVPSEQMPAFYKFTADQLKKMDSSGTMSDTERRERKQRAVRELMSQMFSTDSANDFSAGQEMIKDCNEIVKAYVVGQNDKNTWFEKIMNSSGEAGGSYNHSANVATFAALFSIGLGIGKPDEMAMAGLLHDIGMVDLPPGIQQKKEHELNLHEMQIYKQHPVHSINMIKQRRLVVSEKVIRAIAEHHERASGGGYPNGLPGDRICDEAQVLAMADVFAEKTSLELGKRRMLPNEAIQSMIDETANDPGKAQFKLLLLKKLAALFPNNDSPAKEISA